MLKFYQNGEEFLKDNQDILDRHILDTSFYLWNARYILSTDRKSYAFKIMQGASYLLVMQYAPFYLLLFGDSALCREAAEVCLDYHLSFAGVLAPMDLGLAFLNAVEQRIGGTHQVVQSMDIMYLEKCHDTDISAVKRCTLTDADEIAELTMRFHQEIGMAEKSFSDCRENAVRDIDNYYGIHVDGKLAALAKRTKNEEKMCCIGTVYTLLEYRGRGLSRAVVTKITQDILAEKKIPYLYVDKKNPISNHLYSSIGYIYGNAKYSIKYNIGTVRHLILAGGCFWCLANSFYNIAGVNRVISGYTGGTYVLPSYAFVKSGQSGHREAILLEYDSLKVTPFELLDIYFSVIDPFDDGGQFIDRGENYTSAVYTDEPPIREYALSVISKLESQSGKKTFVPVYPEAVFYKAEEYHQNYGQKHPQEMQEELIKSGRLKN